MPILKNAKKALRASARKATVNRQVKSKVKSTLDKVVKSKAVEDVSGAFSAIDKAVKKNIIHKNKAARLKARVSKITAK